MPLQAFQPNKPSSPKGVLPSIAPLREVMGEPRRHDPCDHCHAWSLRHSNPTVIH